MKKPTIQEMSNEDLLKRKKTTEVVTGALGGLLTLLLIAAIFLCVNKNLSVGLPLLIIPLSLSAVLFTNIADVKAVRKELDSRNSIS
ncbi:redox-active disulfide protein 2 [Spirosoma aerophilum]